ncbi:MAG TPA: GNAT family N-acetyltransferase [Propionibacteriaceae bacterium]
MTGCTVATAALTLGLTVRDLEPEDLTELDWSGGPEHLQTLAEAWQAAVVGDVAVLVLVLPNGRLVGCGVVDFRPCGGVGLLTELSVHETLQRLGLGSALVAALEERIRARGLGHARLHVEQDNPEAAALYRRLGYREVGSTLESWPVAGGHAGPQTYVTVSAVMEHRLGQSAH